MGSCCSYVLKFDQNNSVADPITVNEIQQVCDKDQKFSKSSPKKKKKEAPPKNGGLILSLPPPPSDQKKPSSTSPTPNNPNENIMAIVGKTQTLMVEPSPTQYLQGSGSKTVEGNLNPPITSSLNPDDIMRKDGRALTAREEEKQSIEKKKKENELLKLEELKISDEILKKISKLNILSDLKSKEMEIACTSPLRSQTLGNENNLFEDILEGTGTTKKEEIKKSLIETKDNLEKMHVLEKKPSKLLNKEDEKQKDSKERSKSIDKKNGNDELGKSPENDSNISISLPRKSLLKRFKTIGDDGKREKSKKKVKFKDLFDSKGKKKVKRTKKNP
jgi:hypothetical protein